MRNLSLVFDLTAGCVILRFAVPSLNTWKNSTSSYRQNITASVKCWQNYSIREAGSIGKLQLPSNSMTHFLHSETGEAQYVGEIQLLRQKSKQAK